MPRSTVAVFQGCPRVGITLSVSLTSSLCAMDTSMRHARTYSYHRAASLSTCPASASGVFVGPLGGLGHIQKGGSLLAQGRAEEPGQ